MLTLESQMTRDELNQALPEPGPPMPFERAKNMTTKKTTKPISVDNPIAKTIQVTVFDEACVARVEAAIEAATAVTAVDSQENYDSANITYIALKKAEKEVEDTRTKVKRPITDLGRIVDEAARAFAAPLQAERARLGAALLKFEQEAARIRAEAERLERVRLAELAKMEAERAAAERRAAEAAEAARLAAEAAAVRAAEDVWGSLCDDTPEEPVFIAPPAPVAVPAALLVPVALPPSLGASSIRTVNRYRLEIVNAELIPREFLVIDEAAITARMKAGFPVAGAVLHVEKVAAAR